MVEEVHYSTHWFAATMHSGGKVGGLSWTEAYLGLLERRSEARLYVVSSKAVSSVVVIWFVHCRRVSILVRFDVEAALGYQSWSRPAGVVSRLCPNTVLLREFASCCTTISFCLAIISLRCENSQPSSPVFAVLLVLQPYCRISYLGALAREFFSCTYHAN